MESSTITGMYQGIPCIEHTFCILRAISVLLVWEMVYNPSVVYQTAVQYKSSS